MFQKLRDKFLILNLVIISVMMIISFTSIFLITYNNVHNNIKMNLFRVSEFKRGPNERVHQTPPHLAQEDRALPDLVDREPPPEPSPSFTLITNNEGDIVSIFSVFNMDESFYENIKDIAISQNMNEGRLKLEGRYWAFMKRPHFDDYRLIFLDITPQQNFLMSLIYTFLIVAGIMFVAIFFISRFFANKAIKPIQEAFNKQKQFIADASHELKTPLAIINTNLDVLLSNEEDSIKDKSKWIYYIRSETERMTKLVKDLLYLAQMDYSNTKPLFSDFNLSEMVEDVIMTMEAVIFEKNISLNYVVEPDLQVHGNPQQLEQVFRILLDNAIKYNDVPRKINISLEKSYHNLSLTVSNASRGIPKEHLDKLFDRFYRIDASRSRKNGGYGLGLAIAKAIVEEHGGKIKVESVLKERAIFTVELPCID